MKVYLAGGMRTGWQDKVREALPSFTFLDPRFKGASDERKLTLEEYGLWDLHHIKECDVVFGYMEKSNPSGVGMACELGYAFGLGKTVILVLEEPNHHQEDRYLQFMQKVSHITFADFEEGIKFLKRFER